MACNYFHPTGQPNLLLWDYLPAKIYDLVCGFCQGMMEETWVAVAFIFNWSDERMSLWIEWDGSHFLCEFIFSIERGVVGEDQLPKKSWPFEYKKWSKIYGWIDVKVFSCRFDRKQVLWLHICPLLA